MNGQEWLWKSYEGEIICNGDTIKTALNARRTTQKCRADKLYLMIKKRIKGGQNERKRENGEEGRVLADGM